MIKNAEYQEFTEAEEKEIRSFAEKIYITDQHMVSEYGVYWQKEAASLSSQIQEHSIFTPSFHADHIEGCTQAVEKATSIIAVLFKVIGDNEPQRKTLAINRKAEQEKVREYAYIAKDKSMILKDEVEKAERDLRKLRRVKKILKKYHLAGKIKEKQVLDILNAYERGDRKTLNTNADMAHVQSCLKKFQMRLYSLQSSIILCAQVEAHLQTEMASCIKTISAADELTDVTIPALMPRLMQKKTFR